ncbi:MAG TPA: hypothetical protein VHR45_22795 [Thermoanaerobaculia bacterium]|nr:hypothetical protein [Thermoanaerobaculia bacterium]
MTTLHAGSSAAHAGWACRDNFSESPEQHQKSFKGSLELSGTGAATVASEKLDREALAGPH